MILLGAGLALLLGAGCARACFMAGHPAATCQVSALGSGAAYGKVTFTQEDEDVLVEAEFHGLTPGKHGIHIHEHGDCDSVDGASAGGHFNPTHRQHGMAGMEDSHEGDLGNITADSSGHARLTLRDKWLKLSGDDGILGRSVIVHAFEDDLSSQPAGNSGPRIACGIISAAVR
jgi:Cu-Zn family superoxide dismutase